MNGFPPGRRALVAGLALSAGLASPVPALARPQGPGEPEVPSDLLVADDKLGPFYVKPSFELRNVGWDSNVFLTESERVRDFTATFAPGLRLALPFGDNLLSLSESLAYVYYRDFASERGLNSDTALALGLAGGAVRLDLKESLRRTHERSGFEILSRALRVENRFDAVLGTDRESGLYLEGSFSHNLVRYGADEEFAAQRLSQVLDRAELRGGLAAFLEAGPARLIAGGEAARDEFRSEESGRDSRGWFVFSGLRFEPDRAVSGDLRLGYEKLDVKRPDHPDSTGLGLRSDLKLELGEAAALLLTASRAPEFSLFGGNVYYLATRFKARLRLPMGDRLAVEVGPTLGRNRYPLASAAGQARRVDEATWVEGAGIVRVAEDVGLRIGVELRRLSSNIPGIGYRGVVVTSGFEYGK